jgi:hypothetical protein
VFDRLGSRNVFFVPCLIIASCVILTSCGSTPHSSERGTTTAASQPGPFAAARATADSAYFVRCTPRPRPIPVNQIFSMEVGVFRDARLTRPASAVRVHADADMPEHGHGMTLAPRVARIGDGTFRVEGMLMHMPGAWEIYIDVEDDGRTSRATFPVEVQ